MDDIVIGSGPAGVAAAFALLARGRSVTMLDGGAKPEPERTAEAARLASMAPSDWSEADRAGWQAPQFATPAGQVRRFGSDFAMEPQAATFAEPAPWFALRASRAQGGLSNLWGSALLPYAQKDMAGWPITAADLAPHYRAVAGLMPVAGRSDTLDDLFPAAAGLQAPGPAPSAQAEALLSRVGARQAHLAALGLHVGAARQAVGAGCRLCGQCLHGCPYGQIWSARHALARLREMPGFSYRPGAVVRRIEEMGESVRLHLTDGATLDGPRAYLAAGVLETARILLASQPALTDLTLRDSQHGFLPMLHRWRAARRPDKGAFHTLPQLFAELDRAEVSAHLVHAQIYTWNEFYARDLIANYGRKLPGSAPLWRALARRLIVAQLFLHSDHSHSITLTLAPDGRLSPRLVENPQAMIVLRQAASAVATGFGTTGLLPLTFALRPGAPGSSFHVGASIPMARAPEGRHSDPLGRPAGWQRLHVMDASILPAIPATTITFSVMANAHRIAATVPL